MYNIEVLSCGGGVAAVVDDDCEELSASPKVVEVLTSSELGVAVPVPPAAVACLCSCSRRCRLSRILRFGTRMPCS